MQLLQERMKAMTKKETLNGNPEDALSAKPRRGSLLCNRQTYEKTFTSVKAWFVGAKAEIPAFIMLCKDSMLIMNEKLHGRDGADLIEKWKSMQKKTCKCQGALLVVAVLIFVLLSSCVSEETKSGNGSRDKYNSADVYAPNSSNKSNAESLALKLHSYPLHAFNIAGTAPVKGAVYRCGANIIKVFQTLEEGVLAYTDSGSIACSIYIKTSRQYADGAYLKEGLYVSTGLHSYIDINGANRTVYAFEEMPSELRRDVEAILRRINEQRSEKSAREYEKRKKMMAKAKAADERYVPSTPEEVVERMFDVDLTGEGPDHRDLEAFYSRIIKSFVWQKFKLDNDDKLERLDARVKSGRDYMRESILLFAKWLCDNKWTDAKVGHKGYTAKWLSELEFTAVERNIVIQKSLKSSIKIAYDRKTIEKLSAMQKKSDWEGLIRFAYRDNEWLSNSADLLKEWSVCNEGIDRLYNLTIAVALQSEEHKNILWSRINQKMGIDRNFGVVVSSQKLPSRINMNFNDKIYVFEWDGYSGRSAQFIENLKKEVKSKCRRIPMELEVSMTEGGRAEKDAIMKQNQDDMCRGFVKGFELWLSNN